VGWGAHGATAGHLAAADVPCERISALAATVLAVADHHTAVQGQAAYGAMMPTRGQTSAYRPAAEVPVTRPPPPQTPPHQGSGRSRGRGSA
jgi:hypothetical protein